MSKKKKNIDASEEQLYGLNLRDYGTNRLESNSDQVLVNPYLIDAPQLLLSSYMEYRILLGSILERAKYAYEGNQSLMPVVNYRTDISDTQTENEIPNGCAFLTPTFQGLEQGYINHYLKGRNMGDVRTTGNILGGREKGKTNEDIKETLINAYKATMSMELADYSVQPGSFLWGLTQSTENLHRKTDAKKFADYGMMAWLENEKADTTTLGDNNNRSPFLSLAGTTSRHLSFKEEDDRIASLIANAKREFEVRHIDSIADFDHAIENRVTSRTIIDSSERPNSFSNYRPDFHYLVMRMDARFIKDGERIQYGDFLCRLLGVDFDNPDGKDIEDGLDCLGVKFVNFAIHDLSIQDMLHRPWYNRRFGYFEDDVLDKFETMYYEWGNKTFITKVDAYVKLALLHSDLVRIKMYAGLLTDWLNNKYKTLSETQKREFPLIPNNDRYLADPTSSEPPFVLEDWYKQKEQVRDTGGRIAEYSRYDHYSLFGSASFFDSESYPEGGIGNRKEKAINSIRMGFLGGISSFSTDLLKVKPKGDKFFYQDKSHTLISESILAPLHGGGGSLGRQFSFARDNSVYTDKRRPIQDIGQTLSITVNTMTGQSWYENRQSSVPLAKCSPDDTAGRYDHQSYWGLVLADQLAFSPWCSLSTFDQSRLIKYFGQGESSEYITKLKRYNLADKIARSTKLALVPSFFSTIYASCLQMYNTAQSPGSATSQIIGAIDIRRNFNDVGSNGEVPGDTMSSLSAFIPVSCFLALQGSVPYGIMKNVTDAIRNDLDWGEDDGITKDIHLIDPIRRTSYNSVWQSLEELELSGSVGVFNKLSDLGDRVINDRQFVEPRVHTETLIEVYEDLIAMFFGDNDGAIYNKQTRVLEYTFTKYENSFTSYGMAPSITDDTLKVDSSQWERIHKILEGKKSDFPNGFSMPSEAMALFYLRSLSSSHKGSGNDSSVPGLSKLVYESMKVLLYNLMKYYFAMSFKTTAPGGYQEDTSRLFANTGIKGLAPILNSEDLDEYGDGVQDPYVIALSEAKPYLNALGVSYAYGSRRKDLGFQLTAIRNAHKDVVAGTIFEAKARPHLLGKLWYNSIVSDMWYNDPARLHTTTLPFSVGRGDNYRIPLVGSSLFMNPTLLTHTVTETKNHEMAFAVDNRSYYKTVTYDELLSNEHIKKFFADNNVRINKQIFLSQPYTYKDATALDFTPFIFNALLYDRLKYDGTDRWGKDKMLDISGATNQTEAYEIYSRTYGKSIPMISSTYKRRGFSDTIGEYMLIRGVDKTNESTPGWWGAGGANAPKNHIPIPYVRGGADFFDYAKWSVDGSESVADFGKILERNARTFKDHKGDFASHYIKPKLGTPEERNAAIFIDLFCRYSPHDRYKGIACESKGIIDRRKSKVGLHEVWRNNVLYILYLEYLWAKEVAKAQEKNTEMPYIEDVARSFFAECMAQTNLPSDTFSKITSMKQMDLSKDGPLHRVYKVMVDKLELFAKKTVSLDRGTNLPFMWLSVDPLAVPTPRSNTLSAPSDIKGKVYPINGSKVSGLGDKSRWMLDTFGEADTTIQAVRSLGAHLLLDGVYRDDQETAASRGLDIPTGCVFYGFNPKDESYNGAHNFALFHFDAFNGQKKNFYEFSARQKASGVHLTDYTREAGRAIKSSAFNLHKKTFDGNYALSNTDWFSGGKTTDLDSSYVPYQFTSPKAKENKHLEAKVDGEKFYGKSIEKAYSPYTFKNVFHHDENGATENPLNAFGLNSLSDDYKASELRNIVVSGANISGGLLYNPHSIKPIYLYKSNSDGTYDRGKARESFSVYTWATVKEDYMNDLWNANDIFTSPKKLTDSQLHTLRKTGEQMREAYLGKGAKPTSLYSDKAPEVESTIYGVDVYIDVTYMGEPFTTKDKLKKVGEYLKKNYVAFTGGYSTKDSSLSGKPGAFRHGSSMFGQWMTINDLFLLPSKAGNTALDNKKKEKNRNIREFARYSDGYGVVNNELFEAYDACLPTRYALDGESLKRDGLLEAEEFANVFYASYLARFMFSSVYMDVFPVPLEEHPAFFTASKMTGKNGILGIQRVNDKANLKVTYSDFVKGKGLGSIDKKQSDRLTAQMSGCELDADVEKGLQQGFGEYIRRVKIGSGGIGDVSVRGITIIGTNLSSSDKRVLLSMKASKEKYVPGAVLYDESENGITINNGDVVTLRLRVFSTSLLDMNHTDGKLKIAKGSSVQYPYLKEYIDNGARDSMIELAEGMGLDNEAVVDGDSYCQNAFSNTSNALPYGKNPELDTFASYVYSSKGSLSPSNYTRAIAFDSGNLYYLTKKDTKKRNIAVNHRFLKLGVVSPWGVDLKDTERGSEYSKNGGTLFSGVTMPLTFGKIPLQVFHRRVSPLLSSVAHHGAKDFSYTLKEDEINSLVDYKIIGDVSKNGGFYQKWFSPSELSLFSFSMNQVSEDESVVANPSIYRNEPLKRVRPAEFKTDDDYKTYIGHRLDKGVVAHGVDRVYASPTTATYFSGGPALSYTIAVTNVVVELQTLDTSIMDDDGVSGLYDEFKKELERNLNGPVPNEVVRLLAPSFIHPFYANGDTIVRYVDKYGYYEDALEMHDRMQSAICAEKRKRVEDMTITELVDNTLCTVPLTFEDPRGIRGYTSLHPSWKDIPFYHRVVGTRVSWLNQQRESINGNADRVVKYLSMKSMSDIKEQEGDKAVNAAHVHSPYRFDIFDLSTPVRQDGESESNNANRQDLLHHRWGSYNYIEMTRDKFFWNYMAIDRSTIASVMFNSTKGMKPSESIYFPNNDNTVIRSFSVGLRDIDGRVSGELWKRVNEWDYLDMAIYKAHQDGNRDSVFEALRKEERKKITEKVLRESYYEIPLRVFED